MKDNKIVLPPDANGGVSITPPQGCEVDKVEVIDGVLSVTFKPQERILPKSWEEFCELFPAKSDECYIDDLSEIRNCVTGSVRRIERDENLLPDRATAEAVLALCKLIQLRDCYNSDLVPHFISLERIYKIEFYENRIWSGDVSGTSDILHFRSRELRDEFLRNFRPLIEKLKPLYGIKEGGEE